MFDPGNVPPCSGDEVIGELGALRRPETDREADEAGDHQLQQRSSGSRVS
jgi:hypothetical protein